MPNNFRKIENREEWQALSKKVLFKTFFHSWEWEEFLEKEFKWLKFERYLWRNQALLSLARMKINGQERLISHPFCEYGGPLPLVPDSPGIDFQEFKKDLFEEFKTPLKISFHPYLLHYFHNFKEKEKYETPRETYFLESIQNIDPDKIGDRNRQRSIEKAKVFGFEVEKCKNINELKKLHTFYVENLKKYKTLSYPLSFFIFFFKSHEAEILLVKKDGRVVGGNIFLFYKQFTHSFLCGFDEEYRDRGVHSLVLWWEIILNKQRKYRSEIFDFGATRKGSSIGDFKSRWGASPKPIVELKNYTGESKLKNSFLRDVWSYLPTPLVKILSPRFIKYKL